MRGHCIGTAVRGATLSCPRAGGRIEAGRPQSRQEMRAPRLSARPSVCHATVLTLATRAGPPQPAWRGPAASPWRRGCVSMATWLRAPPPAFAAAHEGPRRGRVQLVPGFPSCSDDDKESRAAGCEVGEGKGSPEQGLHGGAARGRLRGPVGPQAPRVWRGERAEASQRPCCRGDTALCCKRGGPRRRDAGLRGAFRAEVALRVPRCTPVRSVPERRWKKAGPFQRKVLARCPPNELSEILLRR